MINRKNLYGYHIENGELAIVPQEAEIVQRIATLYIAGGSYQGIAETLNGDGITSEKQSRKKMQKVVK